MDRYDNADGTVMQAEVWIGDKVLMMDLSGNSWWIAQPVF